MHLLNNICQKKTIIQQHFVFLYPNSVSSSCKTKYDMCLPRLELADFLWSINQTCVMSEECCCGGVFPGVRPHCLLHKYTTFMTWFTDFGETLIIFYGERISWFSLWFMDSSDEQMALLVAKVAAANWSGLGILPANTAGPAHAALPCCLASPFNI